MPASESVKCSLTSRNEEEGGRGGRAIAGVPRTLAATEAAFPAAADAAAA